MTEKRAQPAAEQASMPDSVEAAILLRGDATLRAATASKLEASGDRAGAMIELGEALTMNNAAACFLDPLTHTTRPPARRNGGEMMLETADDLADFPRLVDTLRESPDVLSAEASKRRLQMASKAGCLVDAVDLAQTIKPKNSVEKMLAHQLAALHSLSMTMIGNARDLSRKHMTGLGGQTVSIEAARNAVTAAKLITAFQTGMLALDRVRRGGRQTVKVIYQQVAVNEGGQAVVTGSVKARGPRPKGHTRRTGGGT